MAFTLEDVIITAYWRSWLKQRLMAVETLRIRPYLRLQDINRTHSDHFTSHELIKHAERACSGT